MAIFTDGLPIRRNTTLDEYSAGLGESLVQVGREALIRSPLLSITRAGELGAAMEPERAPEDITPEDAMFGVQPTAPKVRVDAKTARERVKELNLKLEIPDDGINEEALNILIERKQDEVRRNDIIERGPQGFLPGVAKFGTAFAASVLDPINVATAFVPVVGQARYAQLLARSGTTGARVLPRLAVGAAEGLAGAALVEPIIYASAKYEQADYGMLDSTLNIAFGAVFGGGLHVIGGTGADFYRAYRGRPDPFNRLQGLSTDQIRQVYEVDALIARGIDSPEQAVEIVQKYPPAVLRASGLIRERNVIDQEDAEISLPRGTIYGEDVQVTIGMQKIPAQWAVVDLVDVEAAMTKADNQWRDRTRQASSAQIREISNNPDYDQLQWSPVMDYGAPTLSKDGLVIGGNGRVMGISTAYDIGKVGNYRSRLLAQLEEFGIDATAIDGMKKPMLVRVLRQDVDVKQAAIISNEGGAARMSALEQAGVDAERMGDFRGFDIPDNGDLNTAGNRGAIKQWVGQFPINQQAALLTSEGYLSKEGLIRLRNAILYRAYGDTAILKRLVEATDDASANLSTALIRSAGVIADARARIADGRLYDLDISDDLQIAVERLIDMRAKGMDFDDLMRQGDILGIDMTPEQLEILRFMDDNIRSARAMSSFVNEYYGALDRQGDPGQADMFGDAVMPTKQQLIDEAFDRMQKDPTAAAKIERVSAETREAALKVSVAQLAEGRAVNVDPILESDPAINTATPESTLAAAQEQQSIDAILTADPDASAAVTARSKVVTEAEQALDDALTTADEVVQQGDQAYKYSRAQGGPEKPGVGVEAGNKLGFEPALRVLAKLGRMVLPEKPLILTGTNNKNAPKQINALDAILKKFPKAGESPEEWSRMMAYAFASQEVPVPPYAFLRDINSDNAANKLSKLTKGQIDDATHGFENAAEFRKAYLSKKLDVVTTGKLFLWSFLSRGVSPYVQESLFIDAFDGADEWIRKAAAGEFTLADFPAYEAWVKTVAPAQMGFPGAGSTHNLNAFGKSFLLKMGAKDESGMSHLQRLHNMMEDPNATGKMIRREFQKFGEGVGIDNKVVSFSLLVAGFNDVMVLDRVQIRQLWDDGRFSGRNLYDGRKQDKKPVAGTSLAELTMGARGLLVYEAIERTLAEKVQGIYKALGREKDASIGRFHWESWVADSQQEASHGTLGAILPDAKGDDMAISRVTAKQGEYGAYEYGAMYGRDADGTPYFVYNTPDGREFEFTVPAFREFLTEISKKGKNRVVPGDFKVSESGNAPWYTRPEVNQERLAQAAERWADRQGGTGEGARLVQAALQGEEPAGGIGARFSRGADETGATPDVQLIESLRQSFGDSTATLLEVGRIKIVQTTADLPGGPHPTDVRGMTSPDGEVFVVAENVSPAEIRGLLLHEVGEHVGMEELLGPKIYQDMLRQVADGIARGDEAFVAAAANVPADTRLDHVASEQLAYLIENAPELGLVKQIIAAIRAWAYRTFQFARDNIQLTEADIRAMAVASLHAVAKRERFNKQGAKDLSLSFSRAVEQTNTARFRDWFGDSVVVDETGNPLVVYHGTTKNFSVFSMKFRGPEKGNDMYGSGFYATSSRVGAAAYADGEGANIMPLYMSIERPLTPDSPALDEDIVRQLIKESPEYKESIGDYGDVDFEGEEKILDAAVKLFMNYDSAVNQLSVIQNDFYRNSPDAFGYAAKELTGNDGVVVDNGSAGKFFIAWTPEQIKSATGNFGSFYPNNPDIRYSRSPEQSNDMAAEMRLFDEAIAKADVYGRAIRAAADRIGDDASARSAMQSAGEGTLTAQEIDNLLAQLRSQNASVRSRLRKIRNSSMAESDAAGLQSEAMQAADELANNIKMAAVIEKRNAALNLAARMKALSFIQGEFQGMEVEGFKALIAGSEMRRRGARASAQSEQNQFLGAWMGGIIADMERAGLWQLFVSEAMARETSRALYKMATPDADMTGIPAESIKMAEIINKYQSDARNTQNRYGAWIRDLKGYIVRQTHDPFRVRKVSFEEWRDFVLPRIDLDKTFTSRGVTDIDAGLREMYSNFASGMHMKFDPEEDTMAAFTGASMARRVSQSRTLYFRDGDAWFDYNDKFGASRLADAVLGGLERSARAAGLMKIFGTNPEATITRMLDEVENNLRGDPQARVKLHEARKSIMDLMSHVDGSANIPANQMAARISAGVRTWQSVSKLGGALISSVADIPVYASEQRFQGRGMLSGMSDALNGLLQGRGSQEQQEIMNSLGVFFESMRNGVLRRFDGEENLGGFMSNLQTKFFKWNGLTWWTETLRKSAALTLSSNLAFHRATAFKDLRPDMQNLLNLYNIDEGKWDLIRMAATKEADGRMYLTPDSFVNIPRAALENYIVSVGRKANDATVQNLVDDLQGAMRSMFIDRAEHAVIEPDARTRAFLLRGTNPGTVWGETARFIAQFKSFPVAILQKTIAREIYGRGYDTLGDYLKNGKGDMLGLAHLILWMTLFGYGAMTLKDLIKGRSPRDPLSPATWSAAMMQGGAFGIYGDFLFGEMKNRFGGGFLATVAGPTFGTVSDIADLWGRIRAGEDAAAQTFRLAIANTPFANLFYTRMALDYLILYRVQEWLNPGYLRRMERRIEKENDQTLLIKPSEVIR